MVKFNLGNSMNITATAKLEYYNIIPNHCLAFFVMLINLAKTFEVHFEKVATDKAEPSETQPR